jgi:hypothetical protein
MVQNSNFYATQAAAPSPALVMKMMLFRLRNTGFIQWRAQIQRGSVYNTNSTVIIFFVQKFFCTIIFLHFITSHNNLKWHIDVQFFIIILFDSQHKKIHQPITILFFTVFILFFTVFILFLQYSYFFTVFQFLSSYCTRTLFSEE